MKTKRLRILTSEITTTNKMTITSASNATTSPDTAADPARAAKVHALMQNLLSKSPIYGLILSDIQLVSVVAGSVTLQLKLTATHINSKGGLHGAVSATMVDFVTGLAICSHDLREKTGASVDMHLMFLSTAQAGDTVLVHGTADRVGGSLAFVSISINRLGEDGSETPVTLARHSKYVRGTRES
ncbi:thioesterase family protein [Metarhizium album ARSEF 1941]|uniref:Thioesterase family protein n=1 Tax=Metarhizium album (strain ARSEF 1941) TaxID=1081103 RepID=A0A0B2X332_METAS|nr:thioesterase family protein [Metarhizium album ARSEF 1941]KHN99710.1 thioesterase family protein [Metarhizium album ARSEF 1941]